MKVKIEYFVLGLIIVLSFGCNNKKRQLKDHLERINSQEITSIEPNNWTIKHYYKDDYIFYQLHKKVADTILNFEFEYYKEYDKYVILDYNKLYFDTNNKFYYSLQLKKDTLYYYRMRDPSSIEKEFIVGKYYYLWKFNQLTQGQKDYFIKHRDSLIKVRGNELPKLPELK